MPTDDAIRRLSTAQREALLAHIDVRVAVVSSDRRIVHTRRSLMSMGLLRGCPTGSIRPVETALTEEGRRAACLILADYADALMRTGFFDMANDASPAAVVERLRAGGAGRLSPAKPTPSLQQ